MLGTMNLQDCYRRRGRRGFTLAEILIALGILAIGMSMVAAIFPAAMEFNRASTNSTLGTIICENGLALSEMALTTKIIGDSVQLLVYADDVQITHLTKAQQHYPTGAAESRTGFVMMARKDPDTDNTYQLVTVAYRKTKASDTVALLPITYNIQNSRDITLSGTNNNSLRIGTPVINRETGEFVFVESINSDGTAGTVERSMPGDSAYVLVERDGNDNAIDIEDMRRSPAIGAMSKKTGLRYEP